MNEKETKSAPQSGADRSNEADAGSSSREEKQRQEATKAKRPRRLRPQTDTEQAQKDPYAHHGQPSPALNLIWEEAKKRKEKNPQR